MGQRNVGVLSRQKRRLALNFDDLTAFRSHISGKRCSVRRDEIKRKKPYLPLERLRIESFREGLSAQIMHIGPYADEAPTIGKVHSAINRRGGMLCGKHHEIYIGDPRRSNPEKLKTIIRQPFCI